AGRKDEIGDPDFADEFFRPERLRVLIDQLEIWKTAIGRQRSIRESVYLHLPQPKKNRGGDERNQDQRDFPGGAALGRRRSPNHGCGFRFHTLVKTSAPRSSGK